MAVDASDQHAPEELDAIAHSDRHSQLDLPRCLRGPGVWPSALAKPRPV
jgi:hypothetical protein